MATLPAPRLTVVIALALATLSLAAKEVTISPTNDLELHARSLQASTCAGYGKKRKCKRGGASPRRASPPIAAGRVSHYTASRRSLSPTTRCARRLPVEEAQGLRGKAREMQEAVVQRVHGSR